MLLALIQWLADSTSLGWLRVFNYLTLRAVLAALTAFFIALALGPAVIRELRKLKVGQAVRQYGPKSHLVKEGTPDHGRHPYLDCRGCIDDPVDGPQQPLCLGGAFCDVKLRRHRLGR